MNFKTMVIVSLLAITGRAFPAAAETDYKEQALILATSLVKLASARHGAHNQLMYCDNIELLDRKETWTLKSETEEFYVFEAQIHHFEKPEVKCTLTAEVRKSDGAGYITDER